MATPLGTSFTDDEVVAQSDVNLAGTTVETLSVEFDQALYEELLSSGSLSPKAMSKIRKVSRETKAQNVPKEDSAIKSDGSDSVSSKRKESALTKPSKGAEGPTPVSTLRATGHKRSIATLEATEANVEAARALKQAKKNAARRRRRSLHRAHLREGNSSNQCEPELRVPAMERQQRVERSHQWRVVQTKRRSYDRVSPAKRDPPGRVSTTKRESNDSVSQNKRGPMVSVSSTKRESNDSVSPNKRRPIVCVSPDERGPVVGVPFNKREPQDSVSTKRSPQGSVSQREHSSQGCGPLTKHDPRVSSSKHDETRRVQKSEHGFKIHVNSEPTRSNDKGTAPCQITNQASNAPRVSDLRELLSRERTTQQIARSCQCERLIATVLSECQCCAHTPRQSVFDRLTIAAPSKRRKRFHKKKTLDTEYPGVTINMVGRGKTSASSSDESEASHASGVKEISNKFEGIYQHTRTRKGVIPPINYQRLARGLGPDDDHSAIADSQSSSSAAEHVSTVYTTESAEDLKKRLDDYQAVMQENMRSQQEAMLSQQKSIDQLRDMVAQLVADRAQFQMTGPIHQAESSRRKGHSSKRKEKIDESSDHEAHHVESSSEEERKDPQSSKMDELEARLNAIANRNELQDEGVIRPYPAEWDAAPYPPKFKAPTLQAFDGTGSPNQHIYYFKSQTGDVVANDAILTRLFIGTLKGVAFEWFMKLPAGSIRKWSDLERIFLSRFFEDDTEVSVSALLATKQKAGEPIKAFVERFRGMALRCPSGMSQATLVETCRGNLHTHLLTPMGVAECRSWKQLVSQGEQAEGIVARVKAEGETGQEQPAQRSQGKAPQSRRKDSHAADTSVRAPPTKQGKPSNQPRPAKQYSFKEEHVDTLFQLLRKNNKLKLPEVKKPEEAGKTDDPNYCKYHRMLGHPTKRCYIFKDILQALVDAEVLKLKPEQKTVSTNMTTVRFGDFPPVVMPNGVIPIPRGEMHLTNLDRHGQQSKGLVPLTTSKGEVMWVHPDLIKDQQWTRASSRKGKSKTKSSNMITPSIHEDDSELVSLTDSEKEENAFAADRDVNPEPGTRSGKTYLKKYDQAAQDSGEQLEEAGGSIPKKLADKARPKEIRYSKNLLQQEAGTSSKPFRFDVLGQLANMPARITLYELLRLSKPTREALVEALTDAESFVAQVPALPEEQCLQTLRTLPCISFTQEDMQIKHKHDRPLYYTGYIGSSEISQVQVDPGSALSIMPYRVMQVLGIPYNRLHSTMTTIYGFNANSSRPMGKIKLKCQIGDLKSDVACYVIDADTSYNLLLGRPWIHANRIVPSTLHQVMKYVDEEGEVKTLIAEKQPFKGVESYHTDSVFYLDAPAPEATPPIFDDGNEADIEPEPEDDCPWELNVINLNKFDERENVLDENEWYINEDFDLAYFSVVSSACKETGACTKSESWHALYDEKSLELPLKTSSSTFQRVEDVREAFFMVPSRKRDQKPIYFGKVDPETLDLESSEEDMTIPQFYCYEPNARRIMKNWGYDFDKKEGLNFGKGRRTPIQYNVPEGRTQDYYHKTRRGLGYVSTPSPSEDEVGHCFEQDHSSETSSWDSDVSVGAIFKGLSVNMTSISHLSNDESDGEDWTQSADDPWIKRLDILWDTCFEQREPPTEDKVIQINMGDEANPKPIFIGDNLSPDEKEDLISLIREYIDVFAWNYEDMPGLDPKIAMHRLNINPDVKPVKQQQRRFRPEIMEAIVQEIQKLIDSGFIREEQHPDWVANIVVVPKKNGKIRICIDFRDLNAACPKDEFPLPITDVMIDNTCGYERMSFMDGYSGYNQIKMHPEDAKHTAFRTPLGVFCYTVMPFGLKNAGATYQRAMNTIFHQHLRKKVECYVDDIVVKSQKKEDHLPDLKTMFDIMRKHQLKMNPTKSFLGVSSGKFLGFIVTSKGISLDPEKVRAIQEMPPPRTIKELRGLQGRLAYIRRFISNLSGRCQPFSKLMKKGVSFVWDKGCQEAFEEIKTYLTQPPVLMAPVSGKPFLLYVRAMDRSLGALLAQNDDQGHEQAIYYLSRTMIGAECRYNPVEKECLALIFAIQKMRHYLVGQTIHVISKVNPLRILMTKPSSLNSRLAKWAILLSQYDMKFMPQKAIKGQAVADFLADHPVRDASKLHEELPDEVAEACITQEVVPVWKLFFDGASRAKPDGEITAGVGVVLISPKGHVIPRGFSLTEPCTNNVAEYNALLLGMQLAEEINIQYLEAYGDSQLIVNQVRGEYEVRHGDLIPHHSAVLSLAEKFKGFFIGHVPRSQNAYADALASLATSLALPPDAEATIFVSSRDLYFPKIPTKENSGESAKEAVYETSTELEPRDWRFPYIDYVLYGILPDDPKEAAAIKRKAIRFYYNAISQTLYRRSHDGILLRCLSRKEAREALKEAHDGTCGAHQPGSKLGDRLQRIGYYWPRMFADAADYAKRCHACQIHGDFIHQAPGSLHPTPPSWPFEMWGMDIVGPISPPTSKGHRFILAITDYFSKWAEAVPLKEVKTSNVIKFVKHHVVYRFGVPRRIVHDNGTQFVSYGFQRFCSKLRIQSVASTAYYPPANGLAEAFNKTIVKLLKKFVSKSRRDWDERLGECLWAYRTTVRTPTKATPFSLVYGSEAVLPLEIQIPSLRVALATGMTDEEQHQLRLQELEALNDKRLQAQQQIELYQARISKAYNKKVKERTFKKGDLVLAVRRPMVMTHKTKGKFNPKWEGPFVIETVYSNGAYRLIDLKGDRLMMPINGKFLKKYYP